MDLYDVLSDKPEMKHLLTKHGLVKTLFHRADNLVSKPDDMLSEQKHLHQRLNQSWL